MVEMLISRFPKYRFYTERDIKNETLLKYPNLKNKEYYLNPKNHKRWLKRTITAEYCRKKVEKIESMLRYLPASNWLILLGVHLAASLASGWVITKALGKKVYPQTAQAGDLNMGKEVED